MSGQGRSFENVRAGPGRPGRGSLISPGFAGRGARVGDPPPSDPNPMDTKYSLPLAAIIPDHSSVDFCSDRASHAGPKTNSMPGTGTGHNVWPGSGSGVIVGDAVKRVSEPGLRAPPAAAAEEGRGDDCAAAAQPRILSRKADSSARYLASAASSSCKCVCARAFECVSAQCPLLQACTFARERALARGCGRADPSPW